MNYIKNNYENIVQKVCSFFSSPIIQGISFFFYKIIVDLIYLLFMSKNSEFGLVISGINIVTSYLCVTFFSYFIYKYSCFICPSNIMMIVINMVYFIPITTYCSLGPGSKGFFFWAIIFWLCLSILQLKIPIVTFKNKSVITSNIFFYILFAGTTILTLYVSFKYTGFRIITNIIDIYEIRTEASLYELPVWLSYLQHFSTILIPLLLLMALQKKKLLWSFWGVFLLVLNFSFAGHKSVLFMGILLVLGYVFWRDSMVSIIMPSGFFVGIIAILENLCFQRSYIVSLFFRRQGYVLAQLSDEYYRYFQNNPTDLFRKTFLGKIGFSSPYQLPIPRIIGNNFSTQSVTCNNGLLADVWAHLGLIGIIIMPIILVICFRLFDFVSKEIDTRYLIGLILYYAIVYTNTTWSTVLLTHGFILMCIILMMFPKNKEYNGEKNETI